MDNMSERELMRDIREKVSALNRLLKEAGRRGLEVELEAQNTIKPAIGGEPELRYVALCGEIKRGVKLGPRD